ncbi:low molecular weight phosphatase family protein [Halorubrum ezzemoulense]|uniref:Low molecular weight phosphatase family protein n=1 Tax=Halorubrum ezzemoulense TaxID=337243 RepID=A0A256J1K3_HALEZ|nr:low molecular weight phosphatase family protein [Halorubrum ezzemoulense]OYR62675.1 low molecular weight phosphatase family protein [Halorubrum ezzemoulense]
MTESDERTDHQITFVCVQNAGRSQMAAAFAERERDRRDVGDQITIVTGGTQPADHVHEIVVEAMRERDIDLSDRTPREVTPDELQAVDVVVTMGCSASDVCPATWNGENRDWGLDDPHERPIEQVREIRDEIEERVVSLFDELLSQTPSAE